MRNDYKKQKEKEEKPIKRKLSTVDRMMSMQSDNKKYISAMPRRNTNLSNLESGISEHKRSIFGSFAFENKL